MVQLHRAPPPSPYSPYGKGTGTVWESPRRKPTTRRGAWFSLIAGIISLIAIVAEVILLRGFRETHLWIYFLIVGIVGIADNIKRLRQTGRDSRTSLPQKPSI